MRHLVEEVLELVISTEAEAIVHVSSIFFRLSVSGLHHVKWHTL